MSVRRPTNRVILIGRESFFKPHAIARSANDVANSRLAPPEVLGLHSGHAPAVESFTSSTLGVVTVIANVIP